MRVTTGYLRGRILDFPTDKGIRPTQDKVKQAIFNVIAREIPGAKVLDLFSGCGALGIEAISRGAEYVTFVENNKRALESLFENLEQFKIGEMAHVLTKDVFDSLDFLEKRNKMYDIVILDPPYHENLAKKALIKLNHCDILSPNNVIVAEHFSTDEMPDTEVNLALLTRKMYGDVVLSFYRKNVEVN